MEEMTPEVEVWFRDFVRSCRWQTAKNGPPHSYTIRGWRPLNSVDFSKAVKLIYAHGVPEKFYSRTFTYLYLDGLKYWTMNDPTIEETVVLNRAEDHTFYGRQN